jgi:hypothetical protein
MQWCKQELYQFGVIIQPTASQFITHRGPVVPEWYTPFLFRARAHNACGDDPQLALSPKLNDSPDSPELRAMKARLEALQAAGYEQVQPRHKRQISEAIPSNKRANNNEEGRSQN